ncbi:MAG: hypothetical protein LBG88_00015 [Christensenellaceae bacterium]|jgi:hypothetical protein|nr:hypothetical protein [Christensenellaceae bacterium]
MKLKQATMTAAMIVFLSARVFADSKTPATANASAQARNGFEADGFVKVESIMEGTEAYDTWLKATKVRAERDGVWADQKTGMFIIDMDRSGDVSPGDVFYEIEITESNMASMTSKNERSGTVRQNMGTRTADVVATNQQSSK